MRVGVTSPLPSLLSSPLRHKIGRRHDNVVHVVDEEGNLAAAGRLEDLLQQLQGRLEHIGWAHVNLSDDNVDGHIEGQRQTKVLCTKNDSGNWRNGRNLRGKVDL